MIFEEDNGFPADFLICLPDFNDLFQNPLFSDFTLIIPDSLSQKKKIPVHRFILDAFSKYFHEFFQANPNTKELVTSFPEWAIPGIDIVLKFIYNRSSIDINNENISAVICVVFTWNVEALIPKCLDFLESPEFSLTLCLITKIAPFIEEYSQIQSRLIQQLAISFCNFHKEQFRTVPPKLFKHIVKTASACSQNMDGYFQICETIKYYINENSERVEKDKFNKIIGQCIKKIVNGLLFDDSTLDKQSQLKEWLSYLDDKKISHYVSKCLSKINLKCLILGACDELTLLNFKSILIKSGIKESNMVCLRADREFESDFNKFHTIFVFGFYKFWNAKNLSLKLYNFHKNGGGLVIGFGANRFDSFGIPEPLKSELPITHISKKITLKNNLIQNKNENILIGCKDMRLICKAKKCGEVKEYWDDGIPYLIKKKSIEKNGTIYVLNALPCDSTIIPNQWDGNNQFYIELFGNLIVSASSKGFYPT